MESCQYFHPNVLDVHISVNYLRVNFLSCLGQNWNFILWSPDLQRGNNSLSIQVNFETQKVKIYCSLILEFHYFAIPDFLSLVTPLR